MPKLPEVQQLFTSDSSGGRIKSAEKRKYHIDLDPTLASTRAKSRKVEDAVSALLSVSSTVKDEIKKSTNVEVSGKESNCEFVSIPEEYDITDEDLDVEETNEAPSMLIVS